MKHQNIICAMCVTACIVSACAAPGQDQAAGFVSNDPALRCAAFGVGGALLGRLISGKDGTAKGALAGLAACAVVEIVSRQTKNAAQVEQQYRASNQQPLPPEARIDSYATLLSPNGVAKAGDQIKIQSTIRAISGANEPVQEVRERLIAYAPTGEEFKRGEKKVNDAAGSGEYDNSFTLKLPQGAPEGVYKLKTEVYLNGRAASTKESNFQVADLGTGVRHVAMLDR
jgi:hypothetical protein